jgi:hypothetical protein
MGPTSFATPPPVRTVYREGKRTEALPEAPARMPSDHLVQRADDVSSWGQRHYDLVNDDPHEGRRRSPPRVSAVPDPPPNRVVRSAVV